MLIIDGDYPMCFGAMDLNRDLTLPLAHVRAAQADRFAAESCPDNETMASLPEMRKACIAVAVVKVAARIHQLGNPLWGFRSSHTAYAAARGQLEYYRILETTGEARILGSSQNFKDHLKTWSEATQTEKLPVGFILGMEGADPILWPEQVQEWWTLGIRVISLSHYGVSTYCHGTGTGVSGGLFPSAKPLLQEMESLGMILDVTHASDESIRQSLEIFPGPILASHQNCRALVPGERQFPDDLLKVVIQRGGVIGVSMDSWMLYKPGLDWGAKIPPRRSVFPREAVTLEDLVDHIDHICKLAGNSLHAAIGGDTDGQGGSGGAPLGIDTVADYPKVADVMSRRGYSIEDVENVMYRNWQRFFGKWLPLSDSNSKTN